MSKALGVNNLSYSTISYMNIERNGTITQENKENTLQRNIELSYKQPPKKRHRSPLDVATYRPSKKRKISKELSVQLQKSGIVFTSSTGPLSSWSDCNLESKNMLVENFLSTGKDIETHNIKVLQDIEIENELLLETKTNSEDKNDFDVYKTERILPSTSGIIGKTRNSKRGVRTRGGINVRGERLVRTENIDSKRTQNMEEESFCNVKGTATIDTDASSSNRINTPGKKGKSGRSKRSIKTLVRKDTQGEELVQIENTDSRRTQNTEGESSKSDPLEKEVSSILKESEIRALNEELPLSDDQLLNILQESGDDEDEDFIFNDDFDDINLSTLDDDEENEENEFVPSNNDTNPVWSHEEPPRQNISFEGNSLGLNIQPEGDDPIPYFNLIMTTELIEMIVQKTNLNASKILAQTAAPGSRIKQWKAITTEEFKVFLGLLYHMGTIKLNRLQDYWKTHYLFGLTCFSRHMSRNRFLIILRALHFEDPNSENRLSKISPLLTYFNNRMREIYFPASSICIDESLVLWRGRLVFRQYIKGKGHQYGIKLYIMTDANGVILKIIVYAGAGDPVVGGANHANKVVMQLLNDYLNQGYSVYMDNFYNSVDLAKNLLNLKTYCTGTLRANRKFNSKEVISKKLKKGEYTAQYNEDGICVMKWRDNRDVYLISSQYNSDMVTITTRRNTEVTKPVIVVQYNNNMGGIDHQRRVHSTV